MTEDFLFSYYISFGVLTVIICTTLLTTFVFLFTEAKGTPQARRFSKMMSEKATTATNEVVSYSRVAGVLGAMSLTGLFICLVYWVHYALFFDKPITRLSELWPLFAAGSALFAPYAFNQIRMIGK